jgi:large subunit ribosomal protein L15
MLNYEITSIAGKNKKRRRVGRGNGSGHGKTAGRGHKGAGSRAGAKSVTLFEGGQMPLFRRLPKRGFSNFNFATRYEIVNISQLECFEDGGRVDAAMLSKAGLIGNKESKVKILGDGKLTKKLEIIADKFSKSAEQKIVDCGGTAKVI